MGITGLLPYLEQATKSCHISEFRGGTVAVDTYCLLHKGANACAEQLARGEDNQMYVDYCMKYVKMFQSYDINPIMVFDGRNLPAKAETEAKRRESRKKAKQRAAELLKLGKTDEARTYLKQCIDITPKMAHNLIKACRKLHVDCIVAPYESDAQLAFFNMKGVAECVITEDSDLVLFGCKKVLYKLDLSGAGRLVESDKIGSAMKMRPDQFTFDKFRYMCILSGCDYVSSLSGIGLKKAEKFLKLTAETNPEIFLDRIPRYLNMKHLVITAEYKRNVLVAHATFLHQIVFDPYKKKLVHLTDPEVHGTNPDYLVNAGDKFDNEKAYQVALGNLNPYNFEQYDNWTPSIFHQYSIWSGVYKNRISRKHEKQIQKCNLNDYIKIEDPRCESAEDKELRLDEEDRQINKELSRYIKTAQDIKAGDAEAQTKECEEEVKPKASMSPILARNPFLKKKRLSKFPKTETPNVNKVVASRFFNSEPLNKTEVAPKNEDPDSENKLDIAELLEVASNVNCHIIEAKCDIQDILEISSSGNTQSIEASHDASNSEEVLRSCENIKDIVSKKRSLETLNGRDEDQDDIILVKELKEKVAINASKMTKDQQDTKKRKLGPCRTVGLSRKPTGQQTLLNFFGKLKKPE